MSEARRRHRDYRCNQCRIKTASYVRYVGSSRGRAAKQANNVRRIWIGDRYHSAAATAADAERINAHLKERMCEFKQGQSVRRKVEGFS